MLKLLRSMLKQMLSDSRGFTLLEVAVATAILSLGVGLIGTSVFQVLSVQRFWQDDVLAVKESRHAASWFAEDALVAKGTNLVDGNSAVNTVTLTKDGGNVTYEILGGNLVRQEGSDQSILADNAVSVGFALSGQTVTFTLEVPASRGSTETLSLQNYLRLLTS